MLLFVLVFYLFILPYCLLAKNLNKAKQTKKNPKPTVLISFLLEAGVDLSKLLWVPLKLIFNSVLQLPHRNCTQTLTLCRAQCNNSTHCCNCWGKQLMHCSIKGFRRSFSFGMQCDKTKVKTSFFVRTALMCLCVCCFLRLTLNPN